MRVRIPGSSREDGHAFIRRLEEKLQPLSGELRDRHVGVMRLRIQSEPGWNMNAMADSVAAGMARRLS
jgi:hypothetical protein